METTTGTLWEAQTNSAKIDYFTKNLSLPRFFEINNSNFQEMIYLENSIVRNFKKNKNKILIKKDKLKNSFFFLIFLNYFRQNFLNISRNISCNFEVFIFLKHRS